jgi:hypothetical protein
MNKESLVREKVDYSAIGEQISQELAAKMVKDHYDANFEDSKAYVIGRHIIEQVLSQPGCVGMRMFDAINESGKKTLVYVGIDASGNNIIEQSTVNQHGKIVVTEGMIGDRTDGGPNWFK